MSSIQKLRNYFSHDKKYSLLDYYDPILLVLNYIYCITISCGLSSFKLLDLNVKMTLYRKKVKNNQM